MCRVTIIIFDSFAQAVRRISKKPWIKWWERNNSCRTRSLINKVKIRSSVFVCLCVVIVVLLLWCSLVCVCVWVSERVCERMWVCMSVCVRVWVCKRVIEEWLSVCLWRVYVSGVFKLSPAFRWNQLASVATSLIGYWKGCQDSSARGWYECPSTTNRKWKRSLVMMLDVTAMWLGENASNFHRNIGFHPTYTHDVWREILTCITLSDIECHRF